MKITIKTGITDFALEDIKELTLIKKSEDGSIVPISVGEKEKVDITVCMRGGFQRWIPTEGIKSISTYNEILQGNIYRGHGFVDLGLSTNWAICNIGANNPEDVGGYFSWGETESKEVYNEDTYKFGYPPGKYNENDGMTQLQAIDDAAKTNWGGLWRMPTRTDEEELYEKCEWEWININGVDGFKVTGQNGNSIFLPTTGLYDGDSTNQLKRSGTGGWYWSSTTNGSSYACGICFPTPNYLYKNVPNHERWDGHAIRPVLDRAEVEKSVGIIIYLTDGSELMIAQDELDWIEIYHLQNNSEGDVNGDGAVDVGDIMAIINKMAGGESGNVAAGNDADVNGDGAVDVGDIMAIINKMAQQ